MLFPQHLINSEIESSLFPPPFLSGKPPPVINDVCAAGNIITAFPVSDMWGKPR